MGKVTVARPKLNEEDALDALKRGLGDKYDVSIQTSGYPAEGHTYVAVKNSAWTAIQVEISHRDDRTTFDLSHDVELSGGLASNLLVMAMTLTLIPWLILKTILARSRSRRELEAEVKSVIEANWPVIPASTPR